MTYFFPAFVSLVHIVSKNLFHPLLAAFAVLKSNNNILEGASVNDLYILIFDAVPSYKKS